MERERLSVETTGAAWGTGNNREVGAGAGKGSREVQVGVKIGQGLWRGRDRRVGSDKWCVGKEILGMVWASRAETEEGQGYGRAQKRQIDGVKRKGWELKWVDVNGNREEEQQLCPGVPGFSSASKNLLVKQHQN